MFAKKNLSCLSLLFVTGYDAEINLLVCKQRRFVEHVIRVQNVFSFFPSRLWLFLRKLVSSDNEEKTFYER